LLDRLEQNILNLFPPHGATQKTIHTPPRGHLNEIRVEASGTDEHRQRAAKGMQPNQYINPLLISRTEANYRGIRVFLANARQKNGLGSYRRCFEVGIKNGVITRTVAKLPGEENDPGLWHEELSCWHFEKGYSGDDLV